MSEQHCLSSAEKQSQFCLSNKLELFKPFFAIVGDFIRTRHLVLYVFMFIFLNISALFCDVPPMIVRACVSCCFSHSAEPLSLSRPLRHDSEQALSGWDSPSD